MKSPVLILLVALPGVVIASLAAKTVYRWYYDRRDRESFRLKSLPPNRKQK